MFRSALVALSFLVTTVALAADPAATPSAPTEGSEPAAPKVPKVAALPDGAMNPKVAAYLEASVKLEVETIGDLVGGMAKVIQLKGSEIPNEAKAGHQFATEDYNYAKKMLEEKKYVEAYAMVRDAWLIHRSATALFLEKAEPAVVKNVASKLVSTLTQRIKDLEPLAAGAPEEAKKQFAAAKTLYTTAKTAYDAGDGKKALTSAISAIRALDECLHTTWKAAA